MNDTRVEVNASTECVDCGNLTVICNRCFVTFEYDALRAAAPDLLAAAKAMLAARSSHASMDAVLALRNAIAKAEGRYIPDEPVTGDRS